MKNVRRPLHAEIRFWLEREQCREDDRSRGRAARGGEHEDQSLRRHDAHADRRGGFFVIAYRLNRRTHAAAQQKEHEADDQRHGGERKPVIVCAALLRCESGERAQRRAGLALHDAVEIDEQVREFGEYPHADRKLTTAQAQGQG